MFRVLDPVVSDFCLARPQLTRRGLQLTSVHSLRNAFTDHWEISQITTNYHSPTMGEMCVEALPLSPPLLLSHSATSHCCIKCISKSVFLDTFRLVVSQKLL